MIFVRKCPFNFIRRKDIFRIFCPTLLEVDDSSHHLCYADTPRGWRIRIRYVSDTDTPRIRLGYVSSRILKMQIHFVLDTCIRHVWARLDTAQSTSHPN